MNSQDMAVGAARRGLGDDVEFAKRASSFGAAAPAYARHRPDYPVAALRWAVEPLAPPPGSALRVVDLGAGTGKLTAQIAGLDVHGGLPAVIAVEPDQQMLAELCRQVSGAVRGDRAAAAALADAERLTGVLAITGGAEDIPLPNACADAVLAGQAAHWFDLDRAMPEIARVLKPGGVFAGLWNADDDRVAWVAGLHRASGRHSVATLSAMTASEDEAISAWLRASGAELFTRAEQATFEHSQVRTADSLVATMRTHSMFLVMEPAEREAVLAGVREYLAANPRTATGEFLLPLCTLAIRTIRRNRGDDNNLRRQGPG